MHMREAKHKLRRGKAHIRGNIHMKKTICTREKKNVCKKWKRTSGVKCTHEAKCMEGARCQNEVQNHK